MSEVTQPPQNDLARVPDGWIIDNGLADESDFTLTPEQKIYDDRFNQAYAILEPAVLVERGSLTAEEAADPEALRSLHSSLGRALTESEADPTDFAALADASIATLRVFEPKIDRSSGLKLYNFASSTRGSLEKADLHLKFAERCKEITKGLTPTDGQFGFSPSSACGGILANVSRVNQSPKPEALSMGEEYQVLGAMLDGIQTDIAFRQMGMPETAKAVEIDLMNYYDPRPQRAVEKVRAASVTRAAAEASVADDEQLAVFHRTISKYARGHGLSEKRATAFLDNVLPRITDHDSGTENIQKIGNNFAVTEGNFGIADFICHAYTSEWNAANIHELMMGLSETPTSDSARYEQNREDALVLSYPFGALRDFIHDQQPGVHQLVSAMVNYYDVERNPDADDTAHASARQDLQKAAERTRGEGFTYDIRDPFDLERYEQVQEHRHNPNQETVIDILRRVERNTRPVDSEPPTTEYADINNLLDEYYAEPSPERLTRLTKTTTHLLQAHYAEKSVGIDPEFIKALAWIDQKQAEYLAGLRNKSQAEILEDKAFLSILKFVDTTTDPSYSPEATKAKMDKVVGSNSPVLERKRAYLEPVLKAVATLAKKYKAGGKENWAESLWSGNTIHGITVLAQNP